MRSDVELAVLADRLTQTMLQVGLDVMRHRAPTDQVATLLCRILLEGLATGRPTDAELDQSAAFLAADEVIDSWVDDPVDDDKTAHIRAVARAEFGRRGYEGTTVRDIAAAAGVGHGTVFRLIGSKDELLVSIMQSFGDKVEAGSQAVFRSNSSVIEKLDALSWVNTNALSRFGDEFRIQLAWMRQIPPDAPNPSIQFPQRLKQTKSLLNKGIRAGEIKIDDAPGEMLARCAIGLKWIPENILRDIGTRASLLHIRDTMLRGVVEAHGLAGDHGQFRPPTHAAGVRLAGVRVVDLPVRPPLEHLFERDPRLHARQRRAHAEVQTLTEAEMSSRHGGCRSVHRRGSGPRLGWPSR